MLGFSEGYGTWTFGNGLCAATCHVHAPLLSVGSGIRTWVYVSLAPNFLRRRVPQSIETLRAQSPPNTGSTLQYRTSAPRLYRYPPVSFYRYTVSV